MERMKVTYYPTHVRMGAWFVGILTGYIMHRSRNQRVVLSKVTMSYNSLTSADQSKSLSMFFLQFVIYLGWFAALAMVAAVILGNYPLQQLDTKSTPLEGGLYHGITRVTWCMALGWIVYACHFGYGGPINWLLSLSVWLPFSRLTYAIYLLHLCVMMYVTGQCRTSNTFTQLNAIHRTLGDVFFTVFLASLATLAFESPIIVLEKALFGHRRADTPSNKPDDETVGAAVTTRSREHLIENGGSKEQLSDTPSTSQHLS